MASFRGLAAVTRLMLVARLLVLAACVASALGNFCYNNESLYLRLFDECLGLNNVQIAEGGIVASEKKDVLCSLCLETWRSLDQWYNHRKACHEVEADLKSSAAIVARYTLIEEAMIENCDVTRDDGSLAKILVVVFSATMVAILLAFYFWFQRREEQQEAIEERVKGASAPLEPLPPMYLLGRGRRHAQRTESARSNFGGDSSFEAVRTSAAHHIMAQHVHALESFDTGLYDESYGLSTLSYSEADHGGSSASARAEAELSGRRR